MRSLPIREPSHPRPRRGGSKAGVFVLALWAGWLAPLGLGGDWPQWRYDANRSAASPHDLPATLHLQWVREYPRLEPAWEDPVNRDRMPFDRVYEPVVLGTTLFVGSNRSDRLTALDTRTGGETWRFYADGPVRLPPAAWKGKVFFASDDGHLYCLDAATGRLLWRVRGGPGARKALGNGRLISAWPARGGPVVCDGTVYFAASIWPFMGIFIHALDAETGKTVWTSDGLGSTYINQPHGGAVSFGGPAPQGALAAIGDKLLVPCGRSVPACLDRRTGRLLYYHLRGSPYVGIGSRPGTKLEGGSLVAAAGKLYLNHRGLQTSFYDLATGAMHLMWHRATYPVVTPDVCYLSGNPITALGLKALDRAAHKPPAKRRASLPKLWECPVDGTAALIKAGRRLYAGGKGSVSALELPKAAGVPTVAWTKRLEGTASRLVAADDRLFVVTLEGRIYAFGPEKRPPRIHRRAVAYEPPDSQAAALARDMLATARVRRGVCLAYGLGQGELLEALARHSELRVVAVHPDPRKVEALRRRFDRAGLYGTRISVHVGDPHSFDAPPYVAALTVCGDLGAAGPERDEGVLRKLFASMRPYGGVAWIPAAGNRQRKTLAAMARQAGLAGARATQRGSYLLLWREGPLPGSADWTHQYGNIANTTKSDDRLVKLPLGLLWFGGNTHHDVLPRHGHGPPEQVVGGRLFIEGMDMLSARDVYTGQVLWKRRLPDLGTFGVYFDHTYKPDPLDTSYNQGHRPGANARGPNFVATADKVYLAVGAYCLVLNAATGEPLATYSLPEEAGARRKPAWAYIGVYGDLLIGGVGFARFASERGLKLNHWLDLAASRKLVVMHRHTGEVQWTRAAHAAFRHNAIAAGAGKLFCIDSLPEPVLKALERRGKAPEARPALLALDARTGKPVWTRTQDVFGTWLGYSAEHDILVQSGRRSRDTIPGEPTKRIVACRGSDGTVLWDKPAEHGGPLMLHGDTIYTNAVSSVGWAFSLRTGEPKMRKHPLTGQPTPWRYYRRYGCNYVAASEHLLTFRSGAAGFYDLVSDSGTGNLGGFKSGCTSNLIAANGVLNAPDYTRTCTCSYPNQTSLALMHMPGLEVWTFHQFDEPKGPPARIRQVGVNLGAPGDRKAAGTLWLEYPKVGGPSPDLHVEVAGDEPIYFRRHASAMRGAGLPWVSASGCIGLRSIAVRLFDDPDVGLTPLIPRHAQWHYLAGAHPPRQWTAPDFEPKGWRTGAAGFGYGDNDDTTVLKDMRGRYAAVYIRRAFRVDDPSSVRKLVLKIRYDDAFIAYLNGREALRVGVKKGTGPAAQGIASHEAKGDDAFEIRGPADLLRRGTNVLAIEGHNSGSTSSDFSLDPCLLRDAEAGKVDERAYTVRLHFAEPHDVAPGQRVFSVRLQGKEVLSGLDIAKLAGGARRCLVKEVRGVAVRDVLRVDLTPAADSKLAPLLCGLEIAADGW